MIDYIFISKSISLTVNKYAVLSDSDNLKYPSDHLPVYVELSLNKKQVFNDASVFQFELLTVYNDRNTLLL